MKIAVLMGGISAEREVSINSGSAVLEALLDMGYDAFSLILNKEDFGKSLMEAEYDLAYIALHGEFGEDGRVQAMLDILGKKYTGSPFRGSCVSMDKNITKELIKPFGIRIPKSYKTLEEVDGFPVVVKPAREGSSVGLYICNTREELVEAGKELKGLDITIEEFVKGDELTVGVLNGEGLGVLKIVPNSGVYDYTSKYTVGKTNYEYPAKIDKNLYDEAIEISERVHKILGLAGASRSDFILSNDKLYFLEVNTSPGMTKTSLLPKLASLKGYNFNTLVKKIVDSVEK